MTSAGASHVGSCLSCADILAVLYGHILKVDPRHPEDPQRDRFVLSKGHAGAALYATLAECGFFSTARLSSYYEDGSLLSGHVSHKSNPGIEVSTGSLGLGLALGVGMAKAARLQQQAWRTFVLLSDGECDEGSVWEAALFAAHHQLSNIAVLVDYNKLQSLASVADTLGLEPFEDKWRSFGWGVRREDGHDHEILRRSLGAIPIENGKPSCFILDTVKGKGVSFMENSVLWHYRSPQGDELDAALRELGGP